MFILIYINTHFKEEKKGGVNIGVTHGIGHFYLTLANCEMLAWGWKMYYWDHPTTHNSTR